MPVRGTYPSQFGGPGRVLTDFGLFVETYQGYAQIPAVPTASVPLLDIDSPNPLAPVQLTIPASPSNNRCYLSMIGTILTAPGGSDITLSGTGTVKVAAFLATDASLTVGFPIAAVPRTAAGALVTGTTIPRSSVFVGGGVPSNGFLPANATATPTTFFVFGANNDTSTATALNMSSSVPARPAVVLVTIRTLVRKWRVQTIADYPDAPRSIREVLQIAV